MLSYPLFSPKEVKIALHPSLFINDSTLAIKNPSLEQIIEKAANAGFAGCELELEHSTDILKLKKILEPKKLQLTSTCFKTNFSDPENCGDIITRFIEHRDFLHAMGTPFIVVYESGHNTYSCNTPITDKKPVFNFLQWKSVIEGLKKLANLAHERQMQLIYHHHIGTGIQTQDDIYRLMNETDPQKIFLLLDIGHLYISGGDILRLIYDHGTRIKYLQVKDVCHKALQHARENRLSFMQAIEKGIFAVPGDGCLNFDSIFTTLRSVNYTGWIVIEEDLHQAEFFTNAKRGREYIRSIVGV